MSETTDLLKKLAQEVPIGDLPLGFYLVQENGQFLDCNNWLRGILKLPQDEPVRGNISRYYARQEDRERLRKAAHKRIGRFPNTGEEVPFKVEGRKIWVRLSCRAIPHPVTGEVIGYIGYLIDVTDEVRSRDLIDQLPAGVYRLDKDDKVEMANLAIVKMLGYASEKELLGKPVKEIHADPEFDKAFCERVKKEGKLTDIDVELVRKTGEKIQTLVSATKIVNLDGSYAGREGIIVDVTSGSTYRRILDGVPVGTYEIAIDKDRKGIVASCNETFAKIFGYANAESMKGIDIATVHQTPAEYEEFQDDLRSEPNGILEGRRVHARSVDGKEVTVEVDARILRDKNGTEVGRVGIVRNITNEIALWDMRDDIGRTLHVYTSTLMMIKHALTHIITALGRRKPSDGAGVLTRKEADARISVVVRELEDHLRLLFDNPELSGQIRNLLSDQQLNKLSAEFLNVEDYDKRIPYRSLQIPALRESAAMIIALCAPLETEDSLMDSLRDIVGTAEDLERCCCLVLAGSIEGRILEMDHEVRALREYVTFLRRAGEQKRACLVADLIVEAVSDLREFAAFNEVDVFYESESEECIVFVQRRDTVRAITNLLHNAIKYSWHSQHGKMIVKVRSHLVGSHVWIEFGNLGVPITREEIDKELVFQIGYRGVISGDHSRLGTGVGLSDARRVARSHAGDVTMSSRPISGGAAGSDRYEGPYMTTATLKLKIHHGKEG